MKNLRIVSLFAGIGGFELGLQELGKPVFVNEFNKFSAQTYQTNFPNHNLTTKDIRAIKEEEIPSHDILVGGFPCQTFSVAQQRKEKRGLNDPRGHLFKEILRIAKHHKPTWLFLENVKGLTFKPNQEAFQQIIQGIKDLGYQVN
jgi:DNA (cytosine-5)-methyltransferase 1